MVQETSNPADLLFVFAGKYPIITFEEFITIARDAPRVVGIYPEIKNPVLMNQHVSHNPTSLTSTFTAELSLPFISLETSSFASNQLLYIRRSNGLVVRDLRIKWWRHLKNMDMEAHICPRSG